MQDEQSEATAKEQLLNRIRHYETAVRVALNSLSRIRADMEQLLQEEHTREIEKETK